MRNRHSPPHRSSERDERRQQAALHRFVRERRLRLAPESQFIGESKRLPIRVGKAVTQEELAEHLGISRGWYTRFEAGAQAAFSIPLLSRLGDMLLLSAPERAELVRLAMPELSPVVPPDSTNLYQALSVVRRAVKRLWRATSEREIVHVAGEETRQLVSSFEVIFARWIIVPKDEALFPDERGNSATRLVAARADALRRLTPEQFARIDALGQRAGAGGLLPFEAYPPESRRLYRLALHEHGLDCNSLISAHIRGSSGSALVGGTSSRPHDVTDLERTMLSTIADFASLALQNERATA
jgi:transcriptional regulator with XRE-family HTH domain